MRAIGESSAGFVLHSYPYRETSLILEAFTRSHGRIVFVAKGAKRPTSAMKSVLNPFQQLSFKWFGQADMKTLKSAEHERIFPQLSGATLMSAFYMNELLLKLTHREEAHEVLFQSYENAVMQLSGAAEGFEEVINGAAPLSVSRKMDVRNIAAVLRRFEISLLQEIGYALSLNEEAETHEAIELSREYFYVFERGPVACDRMLRRSANRHGNGTIDGLQLQGKTLRDMAAGDFSDPVTQMQSKQLMRRAINHVLGDKTLHTRQLIRDLQVN